MFLRNNSDQMSGGTVYQVPASSSNPTTQTRSRSSNKLLRAIRRKSNAPPPPTASPPTSKIPWLKAPSRALVVGINQYKAQGITDLGGCLEDANNVVRFLTEELGMERERIILLTSPADEPSELATRAAIIEGLRATLKQTPAGKEVLFYYSGHGSTCKLASEISFGYQSGNTLVPMDARQNGVLDIMNRELRYLIAQSIEERGLRFTMIADSCHSGALLRQGWRSRFTASNEPVRTFDSLLDGTLSYERLAELYEGRTLPYTLIAGCLPHQSSYEIRRDGKIRGAMTSTLLEVLRSANQPLTYQELGKLLRVSIPQHPQKKNQYPDIVGKQDRLIFGEYQNSLSLARFVVQKVSQNTIQVEASKLGELREGSILTSSDESSTKKVAQWEVTKQLGERNGLYTTSATKMWGADAKPGTALLLEGELSRPTLYFDANAEPVASAWRTRQSPKIVYLHEILINNNAHLTVQAFDREWVVRQRDGNILMRQPQTSRGIQQIANLIDQVASYKDFEALLSPPKQKFNAEQAALGVNLTADLLDNVEKKEISLAVGEHPLEPFPLPHKDRYKKEAQICLVFSNPSSERLYVYPYLLDAERYEATSILSSEEAEFAAGETRTIFYPTDDDTLSLSIKLLVSRHPLVLQVSPDKLQQEFRVSATLPFLPQLTDWDIQSLLVSYDKDAPVRTLDTSNSRRDYEGRTLRKVESKDKPIIYRSQANSSEETSPPSIFFDPSASAVASLWRIKGVRRMIYLAETPDRHAADYIIKAEGNVWVARRKDGSEILALRRELALGEEVAVLIDQVACYEQFEALAPNQDLRLPMPLLGEEAGVKLVAELRHQKERLPLVVGSQKLAPLPTGKYKARIVVQNQSNKMLYVYLYRLDPQRHLAELISASNHAAQLPAHEWRSVLFGVVLNQSELRLKVIVSDEPLKLPKSPLGTDEHKRTHRGGNKKPFFKPRKIIGNMQCFLVASDGKVEGAMTSTTLKVFRSSNVLLTYQKVKEPTRGSSPKYRGGEQQPQSVGEDENSSSQAPFVVEKVFEDNRIRVGGSKQSELKVGHILTSFADSLLREKVAQWEVSQSQAESKSDVITIATKMWGTDVKVGHPLLLEQSFTRRTLYFYPNASPVALAWRTRQPPKRVTLASEDRQPPKIVYLHEIISNDADVTVQAVDTMWVVQQRDGTILMRQPQTQKGTQQIAQLIDQVVSYKNFEALLSAPKQQLHPLEAEPKVNLTATLLDKVAKNQISLAVGSQKLEPFPIGKGSQIRLRVSNPSSQRLYIYPYLLLPERYEARCLLSSNKDAVFAAGGSRAYIYSSDNNTLCLRLKLLVSRQPLLLQLQPDQRDIERGTFRVSTMLPLMPQLMDWHTQSLLVSYDKKAPVEALVRLNTRGVSKLKTPENENQTKKLIIYSSEASNGEEVPPPTIFFDPNDSVVASTWRKKGEEGTRMLYLTETENRHAADYIIKAEAGLDARGKVWVTRRQDGSEIRALRRELALGTHLALCLDQAVCYEQFEALAPVPDDRLPMPLLGEEAGVRVIAELIDHTIGKSIVVGVEKIAPLPEGSYQIRLIVQNQSNKMLYVYLYRLEPQRHLAELIWPSDDSAQLPADEWRPVIVKVKPKMLNESSLPLKLIVSSKPLVVEEWPCGRIGTDAPKRGIRMSKIRSLKPRMIGWGVQQLLLSCEP